MTKYYSVKERMTSLLFIDCIISESMKNTECELSLLFSVLDLKYILINLYIYNSITNGVMRY
jgi:hypothetical protein